MEVTEKILMFIGGFSTCFLSLVIFGVALFRKGVDILYKSKEDLNG